MNALQEIISPLPADHQKALLWFQFHRDKEVGWPEPLPNGLFLVNRAKGIHKPSGWRHALSIRQVLSGPYADLDPENHADGSWTYRYFQEGNDPADRDRYFTNRALLACRDDRVPIGVLRQTRGKPNVRYLVLGLALVRDWHNGYFLLEGLPSFDESASGLLTPKILLADGGIDPSNIDDARRRVLASIVLRQGQGQFRICLLEAYGSHCAISDCNVVEALEAAHIMPFKGAHTNIPANGLLLRADLHTLFDLGLITVDTTDFTVVLHPKLHNTPYRDFAGKRLRLPDEVTARPSTAALDEHHNWSRKLWL
jgi:hypothetical protein